MLRRTFSATLLRASALTNYRLPWRPVCITTKQMVLPKGMREYSSKVSTIVHPAIAPIGVNVSQALLGKDAIEVTFDTGNTSAFPCVWLRDNCLCSSCYDSDSFSRKFLLENLNIDEHPSSITGAGTDVLRVTWSDGHESEYNAEWLHQRSFIPSTRSDYARFVALKQVPWGAGHEIDRFTYEELVSNNRRLLEWLVIMEKKGVTLLTNMPEDLGVCRFIEHIAFVRKTHYGEDFHVENRPAANNLAYTNVKLGLHTDLTYYENMPGMIMLQCLKQHEGTGGETQVSDALFAAEYLQHHHPDAHRILCTLPVYFWDKGTANVPTESARFYKVFKAPVLQYDRDGRLVYVRINNMTRDSYMDTSPQDVKPFYAALRLFHDLLVTNCISYRMNEGDLVALDNRRCQHGRLGFEATSVRHLVSAYLDLDEARCRRRELQERLGVFDLE